MGADGDTEHRPWGRFTVLLDAADHKVKRIVIAPGQRLSDQRHRRRREHWFIVAGDALVVRNGEEIRLGAGAAIDIPAGAWHRIGNPGVKDLVFVEIQTGEYFGEDDIERRADDYGRV